MKTNLDGFINCLCTYLSYIYENVFLDNGYLFFLSDKLILSREFVKEIQVESDNPWNYQPYIIGNQIIQKESIFKQYTSFLEKMSKIRVFEEEKNIILKKLENDNLYFIVPVDEFYLKESKFYIKKHNKHYLLVKKIVDDFIYYFDSETMREHYVDKIQFEQAVISKQGHNTGYIIDMSESKKNCLRAMNIERSFVLPYIESKVYECLANEELIFHMDALRLSIIFQMKPYLLMIIKYCGYDGKDLLDLYTQLSQYLLFGKMKKKIDRCVVFNHINRINRRVGNDGEK